MSDLKLKERIVSKCEKLNIEYVDHEKKIYNGKLKWVVKYFCSKHGEFETSYDSLKGIKGCKECVKQKGKLQNHQCAFCGKSSTEVKIVKTNRFGLEQYFCNTHYYQMVRKGEIKRTNKWKNEIIEYDDYLEIVLYDRNQKESGRTKVSKKHKSLVEQYKWYRKVYPNRYTDYVLSTDEYGKPIRLHVLLANILYGEKPNGMTVDHINRDGLDNLDSNLCYKDQTEQNYNQRIHKNNKTGIKGVCKIKGKYWFAQLTYRGIMLKKCFKDIQSAIDKRMYWESLVREERLDLLKMERDL